MPPYIICTHTRDYVPTGAGDNDMCNMSELTKDSILKLCVCGPRTLFF